MSNVYVMDHPLTSIKSAGSDVRKQVLRISAHLSVRLQC